MKTGLSSSKTSYKTRNSADSHESGMKWGTTVYWESGGKDMLRSLLYGPRKSDSEGLMGIIRNEQRMSFVQGIITVAVQ